MRIVILINPKHPVEHWKKGQGYAEASYGFDTCTEIKNERDLAQVLREAAQMLEAPTCFANDLTIKIENYFANVTPEQLDADLKAAHFDEYNKIGKQVFPPNAPPATHEEN